MPTLIHESGPEPGRTEPLTGSQAALRSAGRASATPGTTRTRTSDSPAGADWPDTLTAAGGETAASGVGTRAAGSQPRQQVARTGPSRSRSGQAGTEPGSAVVTPGATDEFPDLDVKRSAPRVDATRAESGDRPRTDSQPEPQGPPDRPNEAEQAIQEVFFESGTGLSPHNSAVDRIVDKLYREVERRIEIERERRGL